MNPTTLIIVRLGEPPARHQNYSHDTSGDTYGGKSNYGLCMDIAVSITA